GGHARADPRGEREGPGRDSRRSHLGPEDRARREDRAGAEDRLPARREAVMSRALGAAVGAALALACATPAAHQAEIARQRALTTDLITCKKSALDASK